MEKNKVKISYAITVCSEFVEIQNLIPFLLEYKRDEDEIVVLFDQKNGDEEVENFLRAKSVNSEFSWYGGNFDNHFANWKNKLTSYCSGDFIVNIDADEMPHKALIDNLPTILESNPDNEVYLVPRINTVSGITKRHVDQWGWRLSKMESPNLIEEKEMDTESEEYKLLKEGGFIIEEHSVSI